MRWLILAALLLPSPALAQGKFVPYTVTEEQHNKIVGILGEIPAKYSLSLIQLFYQLEQQAEAEAKKQDAEPSHK